MDNAGSMDPVFLSDFPRAIIHFDGDAFFTSVEQAADSSLRGRPVVTGKERGIIACASYEAKALGIRRGVSLWDARRQCPELVALPSDYETYSIFSQRMFEVVRRFTPLVEEYSIDEGFADLTGLRRLFRCGYGEIASRIQTAIRESLGLTVSMGVSLSKGLAKLASDARKPTGLTPVPGREIPGFLQNRALSDVWGLGPNSAALLTAHGIGTPWDFARQPESRIRRLLGKPGAEIHAELRGRAAHVVDAGARQPPARVSKGKTFTAPSDDPDFVFAKLARNAESAFIKIRRHGLRTGRISVSLREKDYSERGLECRLSRSTASVQEALPRIRDMFAPLYRAGRWYRATWIGLGDLKSDRELQFDFFEDRSKRDRLRGIADVTDAVNARFGQHKLATGNALFLDRHPVTERDDAPARRSRLLPGETAHRRLALPMLNLTV